MSIRPLFEYVFDKVGVATFAYFLIASILVMLFNGYTARVSL